MKTLQLKSHDIRKILIFGESLRENPKTILFSIPIFIFGILFYFLIGDKEGVAGSLGHMGISFKNYHKHFLQKDFLLNIAYFLFEKSSLSASGEGKVSAILHAGQTVFVLEDFKTAISKYKEALTEISKEKVTTGIEGYIFSHLATVEIKKKDFKKAEKYLDRALKVLALKIKEKPDSLYLHIWFSHLELTYGEYFLAIGKKREARVWTEKAKQRAEKYDLKVRKHDVSKLFKRLGENTNMFLFVACAGYEVAIGKFYL
ncbi:MAG: hypothetical protein AAB685_00885 [Patescibacteria group bacterium]